MAEWDPQGFLDLLTGGGKLTKSFRARDRTGLLLGSAGLSTEPPELIGPTTPELFPAPDPSELTDEDLTGPTAPPPSLSFGRFGESEEEGLPTLRPPEEQPLTRVLSSEEPFAEVGRQLRGEVPAEEQPEGRALLGGPEATIGAVAPRVGEDLGTPRLRGGPTQISALGFDDEEALDPDDPFVQQAVRQWAGPEVGLSEIDPQFYPAIRAMARDLRDPVRRTVMDAWQYINRSLVNKAQHAIVQYGLDESPWFQSAFVPIGTLAVAANLRLMYENPKNAEEIARAAFKTGVETAARVGGRNVGPELLSGENLVMTALGVGAGVSATKAVRNASQVQRLFKAVGQAKASDQVRVLERAIAQGQRLVGKQGFNARILGQLDAMAAGYIGGEGVETVRQGIEQDNPELIASGFTMMGMALGAGGVAVSTLRQAERAAARSLHGVPILETGGVPLGVRPQRRRFILGEAIDPGVRPRVSGATGSKLQIDLGPLDLPSTAPPQPPRRRTQTVTVRLDSGAEPRLATLDTQLSDQGVGSGRFAGGGTPRFRPASEAYTEYQALARSLRSGNGRAALKKASQPAEVRDAARRSRASLALRENLQLAEPQAEGFVPVPPRRPQPRLHVDEPPPRIGEEPREEATLAELSQQRSRATRRLGVPERIDEPLSTEQFPTATTRFQGQPATAPVRATAEPGRAPRQPRAPVEEPPPDVQGSTHPQTPPKPEPTAVPGAVDPKLVTPMDLLVKRFEDAGNAIAEDELALMATIVSEADVDQFLRGSASQLRGMTQQGALVETGPRSGDMTRLGDVGGLKQLGPPFDELADIEVRSGKNKDGPMVPAFTRAEVLRALTNMDKKLPGRAGRRSPTFNFLKAEVWRYLVDEKLAELDRIRTERRPEVQAGVRHLSQAKAERLRQMSEGIVEEQIQGLNTAQVQKLLDDVVKQIDLSTDPATRIRLQATADKAREKLFFDAVDEIADQVPRAPEEEPLAATQATIEEVSGEVRAPRPAEARSGRRPAAGQRSLFEEAEQPPPAVRQADADEPLPSGISIDQARQVLADVRAKTARSLDPETRRRLLALAEEGRRGEAEPAAGRGGVEEAPPSIRGPVEQTPSGDQLTIAGTLGGRATRRFQPGLDEGPLFHQDAIRHGEAEARSQTTLEGAEDATRARVERLRQASRGAGRAGVAEAAPAAGAAPEGLQGAASGVGRNVVDESPPPVGDLTVPPSGIPDEAPAAGAAPAGFADPRQEFHAVYDQALESTRVRATGMEPEKLRSSLREQETTVGRLQETSGPVDGPQLAAALGRLDALESELRTRLVPTGELPDVRAADFVPAREAPNVRVVNDAESNRPIAIGLRPRAEVEQHLALGRERGREAAAAASDVANVYRLEREKYNMFLRRVDAVDERLHAANMGYLQELQKAVGPDAPRIIMEEAEFTGKLGDRPEFRGQRGALDLGPPRQAPLPPIPGYRELQTARRLSRLPGATFIRRFLDDPRLTTEVSSDKFMTEFIDRLWTLRRMKPALEQMRGRELLPSEDPVMILSTEFGGGMGPVRLAVEEMRSIMLRARKSGDLELTEVTLDLLGWKRAWKRYEAKIAKLDQQIAAKEGAAGVKRTRRGKRGAVTQNEKRLQDAVAKGDAEDIAHWKQRRAELLQDLGALDEVIRKRMATDKTFRAAFNRSKPFRDAVRKANRLREKAEAGEVVPIAMTPQTIDESLRMLDDMYSQDRILRVRQYADEVFAISRRALDGMHSEGILPEVIYADLRSFGDEYVPLFRIMQDLDNQRIAAGATTPDEVMVQRTGATQAGIRNPEQKTLTRSLGRLENAIRNRTGGGAADLRRVSWLNEFRGSSRYTISPWEATLYAFEQATRDISRNRAAKGVIKTLAASKDVQKATGVFQISTSKPIEPQLKAIEKKALEGRGFGAKAIGPLKQAVDVGEIRYGTLAFFEDGKMQVWAVPEPLPSILRYSSPADVSIYNRVLSKFQTTLKFGAVAGSVRFAARNVPRDLGSLIFLSEALRKGDATDRIPLVMTSRAIRAWGSALADVLTHSKAWKDWHTYGGAFSTMTSQIAPDHLVKLPGLTPTMREYAQQGRIIRGAFEKLGGGLTRDSLVFLSEVSEATTKLAGFKAMRNKLLKKGMSPDDAGIGAAYEARYNVGTPDAWLKGLYGDQINNMLLFWNVAVQGKMRLFRAARQHPDRFLIPALTSTTIGVTAYAASWMATERHEDGRLMIEHVTDDDRKRNWIIFQTWEEKNEQGIYPYFTIPKSEELQFFWNPLESAALSALGDTVGGYQTALDAFASAVPIAQVEIDAERPLTSMVASQLASMNPLPQTVLQLGAGRNFFTDIPTESAADLQLLPKDRFSNRTSPTAIQLARAADKVGLGDFQFAGRDLFSPKVLESLAPAIGGSLARDIVGVLDLVTEHMTPEQRRDPLLMRSPFIGAIADAFYDPARRDGLVERMNDRLYTEKEQLDEQLRSHMIGRTQLDEDVLRPKLFRRRDLDEAISILAALRRQIRDTPDPRETGPQRKAIREVLSIYMDPDPVPFGGRE